MISRRTFIASGLAAGTAAVPHVAKAQFGQNVFASSTIGVIGPFTGDRLHFGEQIANGVRQALADSNQVRTNIGRSYSMRTFDDQDLVASGIVNAQFACDDQSLVCAIGHLSGRVTDAALSTYANHGMPLIIPASSYEALTSHGYGNIIRLETRDSIEGALGAKNVVASVKPARVANVYLDGDYGFDVAKGFDQQMSLDKVPSAILHFAYQNPDFRAIAAQILAAKPDAVYLAGLSTQFGDVIPALRAAGYSGPLFASQGFFDPSVLSKYAAAAEGLTVSSSMPPLTLVPSDYTINRDFTSRYGAFTPLSVFGYAAAQVAMTAIQHSFSGARTNVLRTLQLMSYNTVIGPLQFSGTGDANDPNVYFYSVRGGNWSYVHASHPAGFLLR